MPRDPDGGEAAGAGVGNAGAVAAPRPPAGASPAKAAGVHTTVGSGPGAGSGVGEDLGGGESVDAGESARADAEGLEGVAESARADSSGPVGGEVGGVDPLEPLRVERDEYLDSLRRVQADFENYKKRMVRQSTEQLDRAAEGLVGKLLPALDTLALAASHLDPDSDAGKALGQVSTALWEVLGKEGLETVDPVGKPFDPNEAEAVMHEPGEDEDSGSVVVEVFRPGYRWRGRVLRAAMVKVRG